MCSLRDAAFDPLNLLLERRGHASSIEDSMHLSVHAHGLAMPLSKPSDFTPVIVGSVVVISRADYLSALDEDGSQSETHRRLGCRLITLRQIERRLRHGCRISMMMVLDVSDKIVNDVD